MASASPPFASCCCPSSHSKPSSSSLHVLGALSGGILSSSCCILQLALNLLPFGCAGFSLLDPLRPYLRATTAAILAHMLMRDGLTRRTFLTTALTIGLMLSQQGIAWYNRSHGGVPSTFGSSWGSAKDNVPSEADALSHNPAGSSSSGSSSSGSSAGARLPPLESAADAADSWQYLHVRVDGIKCEGCALRLKSAVLQVAGVGRCVVNHATKQVLVWAAQGTAVRSHDLMDAIRSVDASYLPVLIEQSTSEH